METLKTRIADFLNARGFMRWTRHFSPAARWALLLAFTLGFASDHALKSWAKSGDSKPQAESKTDRPVPVAAEMLQRRLVINQFVTHAALQPKKEVTLRPNGSVTVRDVRVEVGQYVKKGDVLAYTDSEAQALRAELDGIDLNLRNLEYSVTLALAKKSFLSQKEFAQKELEHRASKIRRRLAEIETTGAIKAPIEGIVSEIALKNGDFIDNQQQYYIKIADASSFRVQLFLPQTVAAKLNKGAPVDLSRTRVDEFGKDFTETAMGQVSSIAPVVDPKTGSVMTELEISKVPRGWISGIFVQVAMTIEKSANAVAVPNEAIVFDNDRPFVYRVQAQASTEDRGLASTAAVVQTNGVDAPATVDNTERVQKVAVKAGLRDSKYTEIIEGLDELDMIVIEGQGNLADGSKVEIVR